MTISVELIKNLREATGVSMMACKKALTEAGGDYDKAIELLRKKGEAKAADRAARGTAEGGVSIKSSGGKAAAVKLLCETDFVARGDDFVALNDSLADKLIAGEIQASATDIPEVKEAVLRLGENVQLGEMEVFEGETIGSYVHSNRKIGVVVVLKGGSEEVARDVAMHAAATNPQVVSPEEISDDLVAKEKEIWAEQLQNEGKPAEIIDKIMMGKERKFREENALLKQSFVKNPDQTIEQLLESAGAEIAAFKRMAV